MIYTVNGPITKEEMGITLSHEHFKWESDDDYCRMLYFDKHYNEDDIKKSYNIIKPILEDLKENSCKTIVETSPPFGGQNLKLLKKLSLDTEINIIPCAGLSISKKVYDFFPEQFADRLAQRWIQDFEKGLDILDGVIVKPGYIKLLLDKGSLIDADKESIKAAVKTSKVTGMPIHCHIIEANMVYLVMDLLRQENANFSKFLWAHADIECKLDVIFDALEQGMWVGFDTIVKETYEVNCQLLKQVIEKGYKEKVLLSQDYEIYEQAKSKGKSHPCADLFTKFVPYCIKNGINQEVLNDMLTRNPAEFYNI